MAYIGVYSPCNVVYYHFKCIFEPLGTVIEASVQFTLSCRTLNNATKMSNIQKGSHDNPWSLKMIKVMGVFFVSATHSVGIMSVVADLYCGTFEGNSVIIQYLKYLK